MAGQIWKKIWIRSEKRGSDPLRFWLTTMVIRWAKKIKLVAYLVVESEAGFPLLLLLQLDVLFAWGLGENGILETILLLQDGGQADYLLRLGLKRRTMFYINKSRGRQKKQPHRYYTVLPSELSSSEKKSSNVHLHMLISTRQSWAHATTLARIILRFKAYKNGAFRLSHSR